MRISSSLCEQKKTEKTKCNLVNLKCITVLTAAAILQLDSESQEHKEEDSELIKSIKLAVLSIQVGIDMSWLLFISRFAPIFVRGIAPTHSNMLFH